MIGFGNFEFGSALQREMDETDLSHLDTFEYRVNTSGLYVCHCVTVKLIQ